MKIRVYKSITVGATALTIINCDGTWLLIDSYETEICNTYEHAYDIFKERLGYYMRQETIANGLVTFINTLIQQDANCDLSTVYEKHSETWRFINNVYNEETRELDRRQLVDWYYSIAIEYLEEILEGAFGYSREDVKSLEKHIY